MLHQYLDFVFCMQLFMMCRLVEYLSTLLWHPYMCDFVDCCCFVQIHVCSCTVCTTQTNCTRLSCLQVCCIVISLIVLVGFLLCDQLLLWQVNKLGYIWRHSVHRWHLCTTEFIIWVMWPFIVRENMLKFDSNLPLHVLLCFFSARHYLVFLVFLVHRQCQIMLHQLWIQFLFVTLLHAWENLVYLNRFCVIATMFSNKKPSSSEIHYLFSYRQTCGSLTVCTDLQQFYHAESVKRLTDIFFLFL